MYKKEINAIKLRGVFDEIILNNSWSIQKLIKEIGVSTTVIRNIRNKNVYELQPKTYAKIKKFLEKYGYNIDDYVLN